MQLSASYFGRLWLFCSRVNGYGKILRENDENRNGTCSNIMGTRKPDFFYERIATLVNCLAKIQMRLLSD